MEAAEKIVNEWSDDKDNEADITALPPEKVDALTDNEDNDEDQVDIQGLLNDVCGNIQIQTYEAGANSANEDPDSIVETSSSNKTYQPSTNVPDESSVTHKKVKKVIGL